jgi:hypothetical protein
MTLNLEVPPDLIERLRQEAELFGLTTDEYAVQLLEKHLPPKNGSSVAFDLLQSWIEGSDADEQKGTGEYLIRVLDEDRLSDRQLFPSELKGISW